jgi:hypothetical protein
MAALRKSGLGIAMLLLTIGIIGVSAYVYETGNIAITQTVRNIATITVQNSALGDIEEGDTLSYTKATVSSLGAILNLTTGKDNVYLRFNSDLDTLSTYYTWYNITVKYAAVAGGSSHSVGDVACTMTLLSPDPASFALDKTGDWRFDFEITTTAKQVVVDHATTVNIVVTAESTS